MYEIIFEINYYDGPIEGICSKNEFLYYYHLDPTESIFGDKPRKFNLFLLDGLNDRCVKVESILETDLRR